MNLTETITRIDEASALIEELEEKRNEALESLLDWIYAEHKEVVDFHNTGFYTHRFDMRFPKISRLSARLGPNEVIIVSEYGYLDRKTLCIPLKHLLQPELIKDAVADNKANGGKT